MKNNTSRYRYLLSNIIAFLCGNLGTKLIAFFMVPLYTNVLKPSEYGEIDLILSIVGVVSPFVACGIHESIMRFSLDKDADHKLILSIGLRIFIVSSFVFLLCCPLLMFIPILSNYIVFIYLYTILNEIMTIFLCYIRGKDNVKLYSFLGFFSGFITAFLNILFLTIFEWGLTGYKLSMLLSPLITIIMTIIIGKISKEITIKQWESHLAIEMIRYSLILIPNAILWWCINASDRFFVSYMCGTAINGLYAVSYKIPTLLNTVSTIFMQSWQMSAIKENGESDNSYFYNQVYKQAIFFMGIATLLLIYLNKMVLTVYVGPKYQVAWIYSPFLIISFFAGSLASFWGSFYIATKKMNKYLHSAIIGAVVNIILNIILINRIGALGAAIATMICYIIIFIVRAKGMEKILNLKMYNKELVKVTVCLSLSLFIVYLPDMWALLIGAINILLYLLLNKSFIAILFKKMKILINKVRY